MGDLIDTLKGTWLLPLSNLVLTNNLLLDHVVLPHVLDLAVHLVNFFGWMRQRGHSEPLFALFYQSTPSCLIVIGGVVSHVILVSAQGLNPSFFGGGNFIQLGGLLGQGLGLGPGPGLDK